MREAPNSSLRAPGDALLPRTSRLVLGLTIALLTSTTGTAAAQTTVAVLGVEAVDAPLNMANLLSLALQNQVRQTSGFKLVAGKDLEEIKLVFGCVDESPSCMAKAGRSLAAAKLTWGTLKNTPSGYNLTIKWLDVERSQIEKFVSENIGRSELNQASATEAIRRVTRSFLISTFGMITISANVAGAQIFLGSRAMGTSEKDPLLLRDVAAGSHLIRITKDGYRPWTQQVMVQGGETTEVDAELVADGQEGGGVLPSPPPPRSSNVGWKVAFWSGAAVTVGLAVGLGVTGSTVLSAAQDKEDAINAFRSHCTDETCKAQSFSGDDACSDDQLTKWGGQGDVSGIKDACDRGEKYATVTNALIGATLGVAAISAYLYYKAYISRPRTEKPVDTEGGEGGGEGEGGTPETTPETPPEESVSRTPSWIVSPSIGPDGAGFGFQMRF